MVNVGDVIENPVTGERITFVRTSEQAGGALAELDLELRPTAFLAAEHIHRAQEEKFQVLEGRIVLRCRGEESTCGPGPCNVLRSGCWPRQTDCSTAPVPRGRLAAEGHCRLAAA